MTVTQQAAKIIAHNIDTVSKLPAGQWTWADIDDLTTAEISSITQRLRPHDLVTKHGDGTWSTSPHLVQYLRDRGYTMCDRTQTTDETATH